MIFRTIILATIALSGFARADFALRDGDTLVFLGDSITAARGYTKIVEHYTLMRYPDRKVRFVNAGEGGDTASKCLGRLDRDVFANKPTVVTVALGINDIGWGTKADDAHKKLYLDGIKSIIERCRAHGARVYICSPAITDEPPDRAENGYLQKMADEGMALAKSLGAETIDLSRGMRGAQRRAVAANEKEPDTSKHTKLHVKDGVHLNDLGQLAMAYAMLKGLGAPEKVSSATIDAENAAVTAAEGCAISDIRKLDDGVAFTRIDKGLPITLGSFSAFDFRWVPVGEGLDRYLLTVKNLPPGDYQITVDGRAAGKTNAGHLARGLNISNITDNGWNPGGSWDAQSVAVKELVDARDKLWMSGRLTHQHLANHPQSSALAAQLKATEDNLIALQRATAAPQPYHFTITKLQPGGEEKEKRK